MMDNEQPWQPPQPQQIPEIPKITPQVPDVTLYSPNNRLPNKNSFFQRAMVNDKVLNIEKPQPTRNVLGNPIFNSEMHMKPSVPDVSLFNPQALNPSNRTNSLPRNEKTSSNMIFNTSNKTSSKENVFGKPSVPDVTILEEFKQVKPQPTSKPTEPVFSESYKKLLINSHEQFMKQMQSDKSPSPPEPTNPPKKKSALFNPPANKYLENPLRKYAPKPKTFESDHNSSSILMEFEEVTPPPAFDPNDKSDEKTFKKVAEMLNEIQKLVIPGKSTPEQIAEAKPKTCFKRHEIMRHLALSHLSPDELAFYDVENELKELEKNDDGEDL